VWIVVSLALPLGMDLVDFKFDLVVTHSIVIEVEVECGGHKASQIHNRNNISGHSE
jgi:hypothetical protein